MQIEIFPSEGGYNLHYANECEFRQPKVMLNNVVSFVQTR